MGKHTAEVLKKLGRRRKMFEDYIALVKKQDSVLRGVVRENMRVGGNNY